VACLRYSTLQLVQSQNQSSSCMDKSIWRSRGGDLDFGWPVKEYHLMETIPIGC